MDEDIQNLRRNTLKFMRERPKIEEEYMKYFLNYYNNNNYKPEKYFILAVTFLYGVYTLFTQITYLNELILLLNIVIIISDIIIYILFIINKIKDKSSYLYTITWINIILFYADIITTTIILLRKQKKVDKNSNKYISFELLKQHKLYINLTINHLFVTLFIKMNMSNKFTYMFILFIVDFIACFVLFVVSKNFYGQLIINFIFDAYIILNQYKEQLINLELFLIYYKEKNKNMKEDDIINNIGLGKCKCRFSYKITNMSNDKIDNEYDNNFFNNSNNASYFSDNNINNFYPIEIVQVNDTLKNKYPFCIGTYSQKDCNLNINNNNSNNNINKSHTLNEDKCCLNNNINKINNNYFKENYSNHCNESSSYSFFNQNISQSHRINRGNIENINLNGYKFNIIKKNQLIFNDCLYKVVYNYSNNKSCFYNADKTYNISYSDEEEEDCKETYDNKNNSYTNENKRETIIKLKNIIYNLLVNDIIPLNNYYYLGIFNANHNKKIQVQIYIKLTNIDKKKKLSEFDLILIKNVIKNFKIDNISNNKIKTINNTNTLSDLINMNNGTNATNTNNINNNVFINQDSITLYKDFLFNIMQSEIKDGVSLIKETINTLKEKYNYFDETPSRKVQLTLRKFSKNSNLSIFQYSKKSQKSFSSMASNNNTNNGNSIYNTNNVNSFYNLIADNNYLTLDKLSCATECLLLTIIETNYLNKLIASNLIPKPSFSHLNDRNFYSICQFYIFLREASLYYMKIYKKKLKIAFSLNTNNNNDDILIMTNENKLKQIILNILTNAIKNTPDNKSITVKVDLNKINDEYGEQEELTQKINSNNEKSNLDCNEIQVKKETNEYNNLNYNGTTDEQSINNNNYNISFKNKSCIKQKSNILRTNDKNNNYNLQQTGIFGMVDQTRNNFWNTSITNSEFNQIKLIITIEDQGKGIPFDLMTDFNDEYNTNIMVNTINPIKKINSINTIHTYGSLKKKQSICINRALQNHGLKLIKTLTKEIKGNIKCNLIYSDIDNQYNNYNNNLNINIMNKIKGTKFEFTLITNYKICFTNSNINCTIKSTVTNKDCGAILIKPSLKKKLFFEDSQSELYSIADYHNNLNKKIKFQLSRFGKDTITNNLSNINNISNQTLNIRHIHTSQYKNQLKCKFDDFKMENNNQIKNNNCDLGDTIIRSRSFSPIGPFISGIKNNKSEAKLNILINKVPTKEIENSINVNNIKLSINNNNNIKLKNNTDDLDAIDSSDMSDNYSQIDKIIICDDTYNNRICMENIIKKFYNQKNKECYITLLKDGAELINEIYKELLENNDEPITKMIFCDENMKFINGIQVYKLLKLSHQKGSIKINIPFILCTTDAYSLKKELSSIGLEYIYNKPISLNDIDFIFKSKVINGIKNEIYFDDDEQETN